MRVKFRPLVPRSCCCCCDDEIERTRHHLRSIYLSTYGQGHNDTTVHVVFSATVLPPISKHPPTNHTRTCRFTALHTAVEHYTHPCLYHMYMYRLYLVCNFLISQESHAPNRTCEILYIVRFALDFSCCAVGVCARLQGAGSSVASLARNDRRCNSSAAATICYCMCVVYVTEDVQQHSRHFNGSWAAWGMLITLGMKS